MGTGGYSLDQMGDRICINGSAWNGKKEEISRTTGVEDS